MPISAARRGAAALVSAGALLLTGFLAASPAQASTIYACVKKDGTAHFVSKKAKCKKHETKLSWNSEGPAGKNGPPGAKGESGAKGETGPKGEPGPAKLLSFSPLTLMNGWTDAAIPDATSPVGFAIDGFGVVHLRGGVSGGTANPVAILPVAARPAHEIYEVSWGFNATVPVFVRVDTTGEVNVFGENEGAGFVKVKTFASLEGVTFFLG